VFDVAGSEGLLRAAAARPGARRAPRPRTAADQQGAGEDAEALARMLDSYAQQRMPPSALARFLDAQEMGGSGGGSGGAA
jgi:hypothetical protein